MCFTQRHFAVVLLVHVKKLDKTFAQKVFETANTLVQFVHMSLFNAGATTFDDDVGSEKKVYR